MSSHTHDHDHAHHHHPPTDSDISQANKQHFDKTAHEYDEKPGAIELAHRLAGVMLKAYPFDEEKTTVMDFACGTGLISRELVAHCKSIVGVDISEGMVNQYNLRTHNQGLTPDEMKAVCIDLKGADDELDGAKFDVIVSSAAFHHLPSVKNTTLILTSFLKPGGSLLVADISKGGNTEQNETSYAIPEEFHHIVSHPNGFDEDEMRTLFEGAGLESFRFEMATSATHLGRNIDFFLAKASKPIETLAT